MCSTETTRHRGRQLCRFSVNITTSRATLAANTTRQPLSQDCEQSTQPPLTTIQSTAVTWHRLMYSNTKLNIFHSEYKCLSTSSTSKQLGLTEQNESKLERVVGGIVIVTVIVVAVSLTHDGQKCWWWPVFRTRFLVLCCFAAVRTTICYTTWYWPFNRTYTDWQTENTRQKMTWHNAQCRVMTNVDRFRS